MKTKFDNDIEKLNNKSERFSSTEHNFDMLKLDFWVKLLTEQFNNAPESNIDLMNEDYELDNDKLQLKAKSCLDEHIKYFAEYIN